MTWGDPDAGGDSSAIADQFSISLHLCSEVGAKSPCSPKSYSEGVPNSERANFGRPYSCDFVFVQVCMCVEYVCALG